MSSRWEYDMGDLVCVACGREDLLHSDFSESQIKKAQKNRRNRFEDIKATCISCIDKQKLEESQRTYAISVIVKDEKTNALKPQVVHVKEGNPLLTAFRAKQVQKIEEERRVKFICCLCGIEKQKTDFSNSQANKLRNGRVGKCKTCLEEAEKNGNNILVDYEDEEIADLSKELDESMF